MDQAVAAAADFMAQLSAAPPAVSSGVPVRGAPQPVGRVVLQSLLSPTWSAQQQDRPSGELGGMGWSSDETGWQATARMLFALRQAVQESRCAVLVTLQPGRRVGG